VERRSSLRATGFCIRSRIGVALQAEQVDVADPQHVRIGAAVGNMAGRASFDFHRLVLEDEWSLLIGMAREADSILRRRGPDLFRSDGAVHVVTIRTLNQTFIHAMVEGHLELGLLLQVAGVTKLRLRFHQQKFFGLRMVRRMAGDTTDVVLRVYRVDGVHVLSAAGVAAQTARIDSLRRSILEHEDLGLVAAARYVFRARTMAAFASLFRGTALFI